MGFVRNKEEINRHFELAVRKFPGAEMLGILYETDPDVVARLLPPPLEPADEPWAMSYISRFPDTNLGPGYREGAIFIRCRYNDEVGNYCLSMPLDGSDDRIFNGREIYGFPKKTGTIYLHRENDAAEGWIERKGTRFVSIKAHLTTKMDEPPLKVGPNFLFKYLPRADLKPGFDGPVLLVKQRTEIAYHSFAMGPGEIEFVKSPFDPWIEMECRSVISAYYFISTNTMMPGEVLCEVDPETFLPYSFSRTDWGYEE